MLTPRMKRRIKCTLIEEKPTLHIGKEGVTVALIKEVTKQLDVREMIKAKILKTAIKDGKAKDIANQIAQKTASELVEVRGHTFILYKRKTKKE